MQKVAENIKDTSLGVMAVQERLYALRDEKYQAFQSKLVPNLPAEVILGVRTEPLRQLAKELFGTPEAEEFLRQLPHGFYEENLLHFFLIALIREPSACIERIEAFLPYVDCWPVCDQATPKCFRKNHSLILPYIKRWIESEHIYTARFGIRMLMNEFLGDDFREEYLEWVASKTGDAYYLRMMVAWYFATALAKQYDKSVVYLEKHRLDAWTHRKAIQKAVESFRVSEEHKTYLRTLRSR